MSAPLLPATSIGPNSYGYMFEGCSELTTAPELPAIKLEPYCYDNMFANCTSLTTAPELPATELKSGSYNRMFNSCTNLNTVIVNFETFDFGGLTYDEWDFDTTKYWLENTNITNFYVMSQESFNSLKDNLEIIKWAIANELSYMPDLNFVFSSTFGNELVQCKLY